MRQARRALTASGAHSTSLRMLLLRQCAAGCVARSALYHRLQGRRAEFLRCRVDVVVELKKTNPSLRCPGSTAVMRMLEMALKEPRSLAVMLAAPVQCRQPCQPYEAAVAAFGHRGATGWDRQWGVAALLAVEATSREACAGQPPKLTRRSVRRRVSVPLSVCLRAATAGGDITARRAALLTGTAPTAGLVTTLLTPLSTPSDTPGRGSYGASQSVYGTHLVDVALLVA